MIQKHIKENLKYYIFLEQMNKLPSKIIEEISNFWQMFLSKTYSDIRYETLASVI